VMPQNSSPPQVPRPTQAQVDVTGGEVLALRDVDVVVQRVTYQNQPCPPGQHCLTAGLIQNVLFEVRSGGQSQQAAVAAGAERAVLGVLLRVLSVQPGPRATVDVRLAVTTP